MGSTGTGAQAHDLLKLDYGYGTTNNNGNVLSQTITVPSVTIGGTTHNGYTPFRGYARLFAEWLCLSVGCPKVSRGWAALLRQRLGGSGRQHVKVELFRSARGRRKG